LNVNAFDEKGKPKHQRGVSKEPGIYFLGLPWLSRRGSAFIWGVWHDAKHIADHIVTQRKYLAYYDESQRYAQSRREESVENKSADSRVHKVSEMGVN
jgi:putative flavoprotein involved in K+ transport